MDYLLPFLKIFLFCDVPHDDVINVLQSHPFPVQSRLVHVVHSRKKIRETKAKFELNLATSVKDNKKSFYRYINSKRRGKENLHSLLDMDGNIVIKDEEKVEVFNTFFTSVFNSKTGCPEDSWLLELVERDKKLNSPPVIKEETATC
ncbi:hypothetical protein BTVI_119314 [Pitangus sulphuratus]|nr:hypothetical protein BTVI_119314 [Pitangus sulphuratus]